MCSRFHTQQTHFIVWLLRIGHYSRTASLHVCCYLAEFPFSKLKMTLLRTIKTAPRALKKKKKNDVSESRRPDSGLRFEVVVVASERITVIHYK